ncbi:MAG: bifunctional phosphoribosylaminoimidazolecarboxamide formyltransferase/IMP cyclohydrolase, partial [Bacteroidota bacterium]
RPVNEETARAVHDMFLEVLVAPEFDAAALAVLKKKKDRRLMRIRADIRETDTLDFRPVFGGFLVQNPDTVSLKPDSLNTVTSRRPTDEELRAMMFAWRVAKHVKSNAIVYARSDRTLGIGAGQKSRVDSSKIAALKAAEAGLDLHGSAVASDAFFPFADGLLEAVRVGATAVIQPGGSVRDHEVIRAADEHGITMVFTGIRHFRH